MQNSSLNMVFVYLTSLILSFPSWALTQDEAYNILKGADKRIEESKTALAKLDIKSDTMIRAWKTRKRLSEKPYRDLNSQDRKALDNANAELKQFDDATDQKKLDPDKIRALETQVDQEIEKSEKLSTEIKSAMDYAKEHKTEISAKHPDIDGLVADGSDNRIDALQNGQTGLKIKNTIDEVEAEVEKTQMAAYMADKMAQFMNSDSFCRAKNHCANPKTVDPVDPQFLYQEIFRDVPEQWQRKDAQATYDKVHQGNKKKRQGKSDDQEPAQNQ